MLKQGHLLTTVAVKINNYWKLFKLENHFRLGSLTNSATELVPALFTWVRVLVCQLDSTAHGYLLPQVGL
jgi:hypothetical protein